MAEQTVNFLNLLTHYRDVTSGRASSWDQTGGNKDYWLLEPNHTTVLTELLGPGSINHIWMTTFCKKIIGPSILPPEKEYWLTASTDVMPVIGINWQEDDPDYYRKVLIKITWDEQEGPSVLCPLGDFFGVGNGMPGNYESLPFTVSVNPENLYRYGAACAMNCYFPMPFQRKARIEIINENERAVGLYFQIDYELYKNPLPEDTVYFHAAWKRNNPCSGWAPELPANCPEINQQTNLYGGNNYVLLDVEGKGHFVGCNLSVISYQGVCWCEGDDMFFIDWDKEDPRPLPRINGSGVEDYFNHAWGIQKDSHLYCGSIVNERDVPNVQIAYRFHIQDAVHFNKRIKVTMEHGHANHLSDDWSSTAYWYQALPSEPVIIQPVEERLPNKVEYPGQEYPEGVLLTEEQKNALKDYAERKQAYMEEKGKYIRMNWERTEKQSQNNIKDAKKLRENMFFVSSTFIKD